MARRVRKQPRQQKRRARFTRGSRRRNNAPARPPPVNIDPWFHVTISYEDPQDGQLSCFTVKAVFDALDKQLDMSRTGKYYVLQVHRIRIWNMSGGPIFFEPCQLVDKHACAGVELPLTSIEEYAGRNSWARIQYSWPRSQARLLQDDNQTAGDATVFVRKGRKGDLFVIHLSVAFKITTPNSFPARELRIRNPASQHWAVEPTPPGTEPPGFEKLSLEEDEPQPSTSRVLRSMARSRRL